MGIWTPDNEDADAFYKKFEEQRDHDYLIHSDIVSRINVCLLAGNEDSFDEIGRIIDSDDYVRLSGLFNDIKGFQTSYAIYVAEKEAGVSESIFDLIDTMDNFLDLKLVALYCFRRILIGCSEEEIKQLLDELISRDVSVFFVIQALNEAKVHNKRFVGQRLAELFAQYDREQDARVIGSYAEKKYLGSSDTLVINYSKEYKRYDNKKICFITCVNNRRMYKECLFYISRLIIPEGIEIETISIEDADSMTSGYNAAMQSSNADIKVYLHQDVCIINPFFIFKVLDILGADRQIAVLGIIGSPELPEDAVMWHGIRIGKLYDENAKLEYSYGSNEIAAYDQVEAVDGLMIITGRDIPWREDLFDGWHFYDASICAEARKLGYKVVVPKQRCAWVIHDDGMMNLYSYGRYRRAYLREYM